MSANNLKLIIFSQRCDYLLNSLDNGHLCVWRDSADNLFLLELNQGFVSITALGNKFKLFDYSCSSEELLSWNKVVDVLLSHIHFAIPVFVLDADSDLVPFSVFVKRVKKIHFCIIFHEKKLRVSTDEYNLFALSTCMVINDKSVQFWLQNSYISPYDLVVDLDELKCFMSNFFDKKNDKVNNNYEVDKSKKRVLIVSHFAGDCRTVSVQRVNYFFEQIESCSKELLEVHLVTTVNSKNLNNKKNVHIVPDFGKSSLIDDEGKYFFWAQKAYENEKRDSLSFSTLGYYWRFCLEEYFEATDLSFDIVIITGNPFHVFQFASFSKRKWYSNVVFDYRDPFANNPRSLYSERNREKARYAEYGYNLMADLIISVNQTCLDDIVCPPEVERLIVPNGFDERKVLQVRRREYEHEHKMNGTEFIHAGTFYYYSTPEVIVDSMKDTDSRLLHIGNSDFITDKMKRSKHFYCNKRLSYEEVLKKIGNAHCGIVFLSETNFETSTKVFDYLAMGIDILLVTNGAPNSGTLAELLEGQRGVYWCKNEMKSLTKFMKSYVPSTELNKKSNLSFSRRSAVTKMVNKFKDLGWYI